MAHIIESSLIIDKAHEHIFPLVIALLNQQLHAEKDLPRIQSIFEVKLRFASIFFASPTDPTVYDF